MKGLGHSQRPARGRDTESSVASSWGQLFAHRSGRPPPAWALRATDATQLVGLPGDPGPTSTTTSGCRPTDQDRRPKRHGRGTPRVLKRILTKMSQISDTSSNQDARSPARASRCSSGSRPHRTPSRDNNGRSRHRSFPWASNQPSTKRSMPRLPWDEHHTQL